ncbi:hypothetical protein [Enterococcus sp. 5B3_DIV0040]|uniref:hypothetical protein n=1 Tax=Enterococcus sp. 5B3_DIV0040 TaxID=1834182 RepID=UPI000B656AAD|nr:hypothetical protein [Enterococcus sp. 5B3_DIV0040]OTO05341.1 hypothetical protein A5883_002333 [Enterococcus sp. 5B3_DIV0040]
MHNEKKIIILQEANFYWCVGRINQAKDLFEKGYRPSEVAGIMNEKVIDIGFVYLYLMDTNQLKRESYDLR